MKQCSSLDAEGVEEGVLIRMDFSNIATHTNPALGSQADWILHADLGKYGMPTRGEQLWAKQAGIGLFRVCCIPFFTYGIALGDLVEADAQNIILKVTARSGHKNLRVAIMMENPAILHSDVHGWAEKIGLLYEWFEEKYLAIDLPVDGTDRLDLAYLKSLAEQDKLVFEIDG